MYSQHADPGGPGQQSRRSGRRRGFQVRRRGFTLGARADPSVPLSRIFLHPDNTSMQSRVESQLTYTDAHHNPNPRPLRAFHLLAVIRVNSLFLHQSVITTTILL